MTHFAIISVIYGTLWWMFTTKKSPHRRNERALPLVYESQNYIKKPSFLHWVKPNYESNQTT